MEGLFTFDLGLMGIAGVSLLALVFGLTEFVKDFFGIKGKWVNLTAVVCGAVLVLSGELRPFLAPGYETVLNVVVLTLAGAMSAGGYYQFITKTVAKFKPVDDPGIDVDAVG